MKVLAQYLPQFHECSQNNRWWGEGFTEWTLVKAAKPLWSGHHQPNIPVKEHYYDLSNIGEMEQQYRIASENNIDGFNVYFYWSLGNRLLEAPLKNLLLNKEANFSYCLTWANHPWTRTWTNRKGSSEILFEQKYEQNSAEFDKLAHELSDYFLDERYMKQNGKPIFTIYKISELPKNFIHNLRHALRKREIEVFLIGMLKDFDDLKFSEDFDALVPFNPSFGLHAAINTKTLFDCKKYVRKFVIRHMPYIGDILANFLFFEKTKKIQYREFSNRCIHTYEELIKLSDLTIYPMACCGFDNTPRYGARATVLTNYSDSCFERQVSSLRKISKNTSNCDLFFINAWNEWGEGMYLEADQHSNLKKLTSLRNGLKIE